MSGPAAAPADLARVHALCFTHPRPWAADEIVALLDSPGCFLVGDATAFALGRAVADEAELLTLAVHPGARRRGRGRALLDAFEAEARARGAAQALLEVAADNAAARTLYAAAGYAAAGRRPAYCTDPDGTPVDALILRKTLGA